MKRAMFAAALIALAAPVLLTGRAIEDKPPQTPPLACENCHLLYEQSAALLQGCQGLDGNEQSLCLDRYNEAATRYESCAQRQAAESAPVCAPVSGDAASDGSSKDGDYVGEKPPINVGGDAGQDGAAPPPDPAGEGKQGKADTEPTKPSGGVLADQGPEQAPPAGPVQSNAPSDGSGETTNGQAGAATPPGSPGSDGTAVADPASGGPVVIGEGPAIPAPAPKPCAEAKAPIPISGAIPGAAYLDRVAMPLYLPGAYGQAGSLSSALPPEHLIWIIAQAMEETSTGSKHTNILNIQPKANDLQALQDMGLSGPPRVTHPPEYTADTDEGVRQKGYADQNAKGKWLHRTTVSVPTFHDYVAAVNGYLWFVEKRFPAVFKVLTDPDATIKDFAASLNGYGTATLYGDTEALAKRLKINSARQAAYAAERIRIMKSAPCEAAIQADIAAMAEIQSHARKAAK